MSFDLRFEPTAGRGDELRAYFAACE